MLQQKKSSQKMTKIGLSLCTLCSFSTDRSKAVPLLPSYFVCASMVSNVVFVLLLFFPLLSPCFGASGRLCFVTVALPGYLHLDFIPSFQVASCTKTNAK